MQILVASLYNVNDTELIGWHNPSDLIVWKYCGQKSDGEYKLDSKLALFMRFDSFFWRKQDKMNVCFNFTFLIKLPC